MKSYPICVKKEKNIGYGINGIVYVLILVRNNEAYYSIFTEIKALFFSCYVKKFVFIKKVIKNGIFDKLYFTIHI